MENELQVRDVCESIWSIEKELDLLNFKLQNVYIWPVVRMYVYYKLVQGLGTFKHPHPALKFDLKKKVEFLSKMISSFFFKNPFFTSNKVSNLVIPHDRKVDGEDIYTSQLLKELKGDCIVIDTYDSPLKSSYSMDIFLVFATLMAKTLSRVIKIRNEKIVGICNKFRKSFFIDIHIEKIISFQLYKFKVMKFFYSLLFKTIKVKRLFIVVAYTKAYILSAAKEAGIEIVELQHGTITKYHLGYSYPYGVKLEYFPDKILTFGEFWNDKSIFPKGTTFGVIGAPYIDKLRSNKKEKKPRTIVFSSQGVIGDRLIKYALNLALELSEYEIYFNLHPSESLETYQKNYPNLPVNFKLIFKDPNIFELLAFCEYQVGVFSTTIFEGIALDTKVVLVDLPGVEYMERLESKFDIMKVKTVSELRDAILNDSQVLNGEEFYKNSEKNILEKFNF